MLRVICHADVIPTPCIEIVQLPSDGLFDYLKACQFTTHVLNKLPEYTGFIKTMSITFRVKGHLQLKQNLAELRKVFPIINPEFLAGTLSTPMFLAGLDKIQLNQDYRIWSQHTTTTIKNTYPWLGMALWVRMIQVPACHAQTISMEPLEVVHISSGCGKLSMTSVTGHATIWIHNSVFKMQRNDNGFSDEINQFLYTAFVLPKTHRLPNYRSKGVLFNAEFQWFSQGDLHKRIVYTRRQHLEINIFSQYQSQKFSIELECDISLGQLRFTYIRRIPVAKQHFKNHIGKIQGTTSWKGDQQSEMCFVETSSCYRYNNASEITWNIAQARCAEHNSNLVSINSPTEWHSLLSWAYNFILNNMFLLTAHIDDIDAFKGRLWFIGQRRMEVCNCLFFLGYGRLLSCTFCKIPRTIKL